jgi:hypothetical protein
MTEDQPVAGPFDIVDVENPLAAFEGRKGGLLHLAIKIKGQMASEHKLLSAAVFNGAAAADSRLFPYLQDGSVACFGE